VAVVIAAVLGHAPAVALLGRRPDGEHRIADAQVKVVRDRIEGAALIALRACADVIEMHVQAGDASRVLRADRNGVRVVDAEPDTSLPTIEILEQRADSESDPEPAIVALHRAMLTDVERATAQRQLKATLRKLTQRLGAIASDELRARGHEQQALRVRSLVACAARAPRGLTLIEGVDYTSGVPEPVCLPLDPARTAREQLEEVFARARRMKRGEPIRKMRQSQAEHAVAALERALEEIACALDPQCVRHAYSSLIEQLPAGVRPRLHSQGVARKPSGAPGSALSTKDPSIKERSCAREYRASDGTRLLVGRDAKSNDLLTTRVARPHDVWMHARGSTGSHVVIPTDRGKSASAEALIDAATLAAHFSEARGNDTVEVSWCERRFVRKPKGAPAGMVTLAREKLLRLRFEPARLERLLATVR
jgi:predicted ribosome quality control (RQC) complex YloA/Tae2 family protein